MQFSPSSSRSSLSSRPRHEKLLHCHDLVTEGISPIACTVAQSVVLGDEKTGETLIQPEKGVSRGLLNDEQ